MVLTVWCVCVRFPPPRGRPLSPPPSLLAVWRASPPKGSQMSCRGAHVFLRRFQSACPPASATERKGGGPRGLMGFHLQARPESGLDCLMCAIFIKFGEFREHTGAAEVLRYTADGEVYTGPGKVDVALKSPRPEMAEASPQVYSPLSLISFPHHSLVYLLIVEGDGLVTSCLSRLSLLPLSPSPTQTPTP